MVHLTTRTLGEICDEVGGVVRTGPFGSQLHESDYQDEGVPVVMPKNIIDGKISLYDIARIGDQDVARLSQHKLHKGDIIYGRRGDIGRRALVTPREEGLLCGTGSLRISLGDSILNPGFLFYYLGQLQITAWISNQAIGATMPNLNTSIIRSIPVTYPPLPIQHKIASILSSYDDLIENNTRRIKILEEMARTIYREWFVHFRCPRHEKVKMVDSPLGKIPEGWESSPLADLCTRITDGSHSSPKSVDVGYPMASVKDMTNWGLNEESCRRIAESDYRDLVRNDCKPLVNDVLIAKDGSYLKHAFVVEEEKELVILSSIAILRPNLRRILPHVLCTYLRQPEVRSRLSGYVSGVALPRIILKDFAKFLVLVPTLSLQQQFMILVEPKVRLLQSLARKNSLLRRTRDLLLPKLISGEVEVNGRKISAEAGLP